MTTDRCRTLLILCTLALGTSGCLGDDIPVYVYNVTHLPVEVEIVISGAAGLVQNGTYNGSRGDYLEAMRLVLDSGDYRIRASSGPLHNETTFRVPHHQGLDVTVNADRIEIDRGQR